MTYHHGVYLFCIAIFSLSGQAMADHPSVAFGVNTAGPIHTISTSTLPKGVYAFGIQTELIENDAFSTEQLEGFAEDGLEGTHSVDRLINTSISFSYGITSDLSVSARLPYIESHNIREGEIEDGQAETHSHGDASGFGDLLLLGQYGFWQNENVDLSVNFGLKLPTGETNEKDSEGIRFETEFQPGSGSWDYLFGLSASLNAGSWGYHANVLYNKTTEGSKSTELGDEISYNAALTYNISGAGDNDVSHKHASHNHDHGEMKWSLMLELNGKKRTRDKISGTSQVHTGGNMIFLSPGIRFSSGKLGGFVSVSIPVVENQNGKQTDFDNRILAGISFAL